MKKVLAWTCLLVLMAVGSGHTQELDTLFQYSGSIAATKERSFPVNVGGKGYTKIKIECDVDQQQVVLYYKTSTMKTFDSAETTGILPYYNYLYHKKEFLLSASLPVKTAGSVTLMLKNKSDKDTSVQLTVYGLTQNY